MSTSHPTTPHPSRRAVVKASALASAALATTSAAAVSANPSTPAHSMFQHGVASGDPMADRVIVWTRVTPSPEAFPGSATGPDAYVRWEVATDDSFNRVVSSGGMTTGAWRDHTVKVDVTGLAPMTRYFYRFSYRGHYSPTGRTLTAPSGAMNPGRLRFAVTSCASYEAGYFGAYRHMALREDLNAVIHLGDYIYEYENGKFAGKNGTVRPMEPKHEIVSLADYRIRHAHYKLDPDLQQLHAAHPFVCTWDDHEVANDAWRDGAENHAPHEGSFANRKAASATAYFEWMPVRPNSLNDGGKLYRRLRFGSLMELSMLDLRSYRDKPPSYFDGRTPYNPGHTMTGTDQFQWLTRGLQSSTARWNVIGNSVLIAPALLPTLNPQVTGSLTNLLGIPQDGIAGSPDTWDGYRAERHRLLSTIHDHTIDNCVFLTGDIHMGWASDVPLHLNQPAGTPPVASEFVCASVTSKNLDDFIGTPEGSDLSVGAANLVKAANPHIRYLDADRHGYSIFEVTEDFAHMDWFAIKDRTNPNSDHFYLTSWRRRHGMNPMEPAGPLPT